MFSSFSSCFIHVVDVYLLSHFCLFVQIMSFKAAALSVVVTLAWWRSPSRSTLAKWECKRARFVFMMEPAESIKYMNYAFVYVHECCGVFTLGRVGLGLDGRSGGWVVELLYYLKEALWCHKPASLIWIIAEETSVDGFCAGSMFMCFYAFIQIGRI